MCSRDFERNIRIGGRIAEKIALGIAIITRVSRIPGHVLSAHKIFVGVQKAEIVPHFVCESIAVVEATVIHNDPGNP